MADSLKKPKAKAEIVDYSSPAVDKAVDVIEYLAFLRDGVSITNIANGVGRSVGEIYRTVRVLERRRLVYKNISTDRFHLSLRLFELAHKFPPVERLVSVAQVELDVLAKKSLRSCHLAVVEGHRVVIVATMESPLPMHYSVRVGSAFELFETSSGVVITAYSTQEQRQLLLKSVKLPVKEELELRFEQILANGYEIRKSDTVEGLVNIAVPVRSQEGKILAALTIPYLKQTAAKLDTNAVLKLQLATSLRIGRELG